MSTKIHSNSIFGYKNEGLILVAQKKSNMLEVFREKLLDKVNHAGHYTRFSAQARRYLGPTQLIILLGLLGFFISYSYNSSISSIFLSSDITSGNCVEVAKSITGTYGMDGLGYWSGNSNFAQTRSIYSFTVNSFTHTTAEYINIIKNLQSKVNTVSLGAPTRSLTDNLLYWMSWAFITTDTSTSSNMRFQLTGDIPSVFNRFSKQAVFGSKVSNCRIPPVVSYNSLDGTVQITYSYSAFTTEKSCSSISSPENLGYVADSDGDNFNLRLDMRSLITALAVNEGVLPYSYLIDVQGLDKTVYNYRGVYYASHKKIDARYPGSAPIYCFLAVGPLPHESNQPTHFCVAKIASVYGYPFFFHKGVSGQNITDTIRISKYTPMPCNCTSITGTSSYCSVFDLVTGLVLFGAKGGQLRSFSDQFTGVMDMLTGTINTPQTSGFTPSVASSSIVAMDSLIGIPPTSTPANGPPANGPPMPSAPVNLLSPHSSITPSNSPVPKPTVRPTLYSATTLNTNTSSVNSLVYNAVFQSLTLANGKATKVDNHTLSARDYIAFKALTSKAYTDAAYDFCGGSCYMIVLNYLDPYDTYINPYFLSVNGGSCSDTFSTSTGTAAWLNFQKTPPTSLIESYYKCTLSTRDAIITAVGVSMGNLSAVSVPLIVVVILIGYLFQFKMLQHPRFIYPYDANTRHKVLDELAVHYLKVRDGLVESRALDTELIQLLAHGTNTTPLIHNDTDLRLVHPSTQAPGGVDVVGNM